MKVWTCNNFRGRYPVGSAAVVVARNRPEAKELLEQELARIGLTQRGEDLEVDDMVRLPIQLCKVRILVDGNY